MAKTTTITVALYPQDISRLKAMGDVLGMSRSELVRRMIDAAYVQPGVVEMTRQLSERKKDEDGCVSSAES